MSGIKSKVKTLVSLMMIFAMIFTSIPSMADELLDFQGTFQVIAGQHQPIGTATVEIDNGMLTLRVAMEPDWPAKEYSLYILEGEPTDRPNPGHAPIKSSNLDNAASFTIGPIDLSLPELNPGQCLTRYLVLHVVSGTETAYTGNIIKPDQGSWFGFITVTLCEPKTTPTGTITIQKIVENSEGQPLTSDETPFNITITHPDSTTTTATITGNGTAPPLTNLPLGTYTISEAAPANYTLKSITSSTLTATNDLQITISEADLDHHVTVTNRKNADENPKTWSLKITKRVVDSQGQTQTNDQTTFAVKITGLSPPNTNITTFERTIQLVGNASSPAIPIPGPGDYRISELAPTGYLLKSIHHGDTLLTDGVITISENDHTTPIELTVTNQKEDAPLYKAALKLTKKVVDADFKTISTNDTFNINIQYPDGSTHTQTLKGDGTPVTLNNLKPGPYTISEDAPKGFTLKSIQSGDTTTTGALTIILSEHDPVQPVEVTVTNQQDAEPTPPTGSIRLIKFRDLNQNGIKNGNDTLLNQIQFKLESAPPEGSAMPPLSVIKFTGQDNFEDGEILFTGLPYGRYKLTELSSHTITAPADLIDGDMFIHVPAYNGETPIQVVLEVGNYWEEPGGPPPPPPPPGERRGEIRIHKFLDTNKNNFQESSEFDMQNITFELYAANKTTLISTQKTNAAGELTFTNLPYGAYYLREVSEYTITSPSFSADGFSTTPITINSTQALTFNVGNFRDTTTEDVPPKLPPKGPPDEPPETEIVEEEPPPLGAPPWEPPNTLPPTGEVPAAMLNLLGTLLLLAGAFLKYQY